MQRQCIRNTGAVVVGIQTRDHRISRQAPYQLLLSEYGQSIVLIMFWN